MQRPNGDSIALVRCHFGHRRRGRCGRVPHDRERTDSLPGGSKLIRRRPPEPALMSRLHRRVDRNFHGPLRPWTTEGRAFTGAWIETPRFARVPRAGASRLHRRVDRNLQRDGEQHPLRVSRLHRRVDRNWHPDVHQPTQPSRAVTGAWIENSACRPHTSRPACRAFTGAWIETGSTSCARWRRPVAPSQARG